MAFSYWAAFQLRFDFRIPDWAFGALIQTLPWLIAIRGLMFLPFRLYAGLWKYTSVYDLQALLAGIASSTVIFASVTIIARESFPRSVLIIDPLIVTLLLGGIRMVRRMAAEFGSSRAASGSRTLVYGAGDAGEMIVREMRQRGASGLRPIGFIDDDPSKVGRRIHGVRVLGTRKELEDILDELEPSEILLALPGVAPETIRAIVRAIEPYKLPIKTLPALKDIIDGKIGVEQIRTLKVEDLLARPPIGLNTKAVRELIRGHRVLVTGAGGSIGSELCRQVLEFEPAALVLFERYENSLHAIRLELEDNVSKTAGLASRGVSKIVPVVGDVTDPTVVRSAFEKHRPEIVFHAAAHKHVGLMEENPCEAVKNNVGGTRALAAAAEAAGVDRFILISTDKAANPTSIMGASKRVAELAVQAQARGSSTSFSIVRFGNVLGSNGSVVPRFLDQIQRGGPVTVTHPDVKRFFMLIPEAVQLVLHSAAEARGGATYVLDMGEQIKLVDMARNLIRLSGKVPDEDVKIEFIGLRPGEKMEEELVSDSETIVATSVPKVFAVYAQPVGLDDEFNAAVRELESLAAAGEVGEVVTRLRVMAKAKVVDDAPLQMGQSAAPVPLEPRQDPHTQTCPQCSQPVHRSKAKRFDENLRKRFTGQRLFRCAECGWRGWLEPIAPTPLPIPGAIATVDLTALDSLSPAKPATPRRFSPKDLQ
jgi:FlaA1/EpsC-like NDP-sugar epimerase